MKKLITITLMAINIFATSTTPTTEFNDWLNELKIELNQEHGFSYALLDDAFDGVTFNEDVIKYDRRQPEFVMSVGRYLDIVISETRIEKGQRYQAELEDIFIDIENDFNFQDRFLLSFWALETNFSSITGKLDIIRSLATLSYDGRRSAFFKRELVNALTMLQKGIYSYPSERMQGSWAGAMGSTQFMPSTMLAYAIDYDKDGQINMWENQRDFLGSPANFLSKVGWNGDESWGHEIDLPSDFDYFHSGLKYKEDLQYWIDRGITLRGGTQLPYTSGKTAIYLPQGANGPAFIVYPNFFTIFKWNNSEKYALGIGILSDLIAKRGDYFSKFNLDEESFMSFEMAKKIQAKLNELGLDAGPVDGIPGKQTTAAIQRFQVSEDIIPDGYLTKDLADQILAK
ncbi:lytic murein transglycosylase [Halobacteriovorax sp. DA5]|uniref:lytic murein transglycosylase n=1 Tax=Halobacteriovorax sp. DA5 TaxID=2067553 RepID=UPI0011AF3F80|nr:lytic murein transglycosylase [Halobacteriovorax sp. DA5]